jgi:hypothetical protein
MIKTNYLLIFVLFILVIYNQYQIRNIKNKEHATNTCSTADMTAIENLNKLAESIQSGSKLVIPSDVEIQGNLALTGADATLNVQPTTGQPGINFYNGTDQKDYPGEQLFDWVGQVINMQNHGELEIYDGGISASYVQFVTGQEDPPATPGYMSFDGTYYRGFQGGDSSYIYFSLVDSP